MAWAPKEESRIAIKFWLDCLEVVIVISGIITAAVTVIGYLSQQEAAAKAQAEREIEQDERAREQAAAIKRELRQPYEEKKLNLYLEAARVVAHLAATPDIERNVYEARFWELYWGELAFVESTTSRESTGGPNPSVERLMVDFCHQAFFGRCSQGPDETGETIGIGKSPTGSTAAAIELARKASKEIRQEWENLGR